MAVIKENKDPDVTTEGNTKSINILGLRNLVSPNSISNFLKEKMRHDKGEKGENMGMGTVEIRSH